MPRNTCFYLIGGTNTLRLASKAILKKWGTNLQNVEKSMRRIYIPDFGYIFVQVDQSGAEALIVAYLCRDGNFRQLFINNVKPHVFVALHLFKDVWQRKLNEHAGEFKLDINEIASLSIEKLNTHPRWNELNKLIKSSDTWPAQERYYYIAKQVCHSSNYGIRPTTFQLNVLEKSKGKIVLTTRQAENYLSFYHNLFPEIREWHKEIEQQLHETRILYNLFGFPRFFSGEINEASLKEAFAFIPQSTVGTITNVAYTKLQDFIERTGASWDLLANTHDSYLCQCPIGEEFECARVMQQFINQTFTYREVSFSMKSEAVAGYNWAPFDEKKNPQGLKEI